MMEMTRREFLKESLAAMGFLALPGLPIFAAPAGWKPAKDGKKPRKEAGIRISIPMADGNSASRVHAYNVVVVGDDPKARYFKSVYFSGVNSGIGHEPNGGVTTLEIPISELPPGKTLTIAARPLTSLGTYGRPISVEVHT